MRQAERRAASARSTQQDDEEDQAAIIREEQTDTRAANTLRVPMRSSHRRHGLQEPRRGEEAGESDARNRPPSASTSGAPIASSRSVAAGNSGRRQTRATRACADAARPDDPPVHPDVEAASSPGVLHRLFVWAGVRAPTRRINSESDLFLRCVGGATRQDFGFCQPCAVAVRAQSCNLGLGSLSPPRRSVPALGGLCPSRRQQLRSRRFRERRNHSAFRIENRTSAAQQVGTRRSSSHSSEFCSRASALVWRDRLYRWRAFSRQPSSRCVSGS
jgi:hypothetical protein